MTRQLTNEELELLKPGSSKRPRSFIADYIAEYAGDKPMQRLARADARRVLKPLVDGPRGTHGGTPTPDSMAYVKEMQRILDAASDRR